VSRGGRDWDLFAIDAALNEAEPIGVDLETWAQWYDRKAAAAVLLREHASVKGDRPGVETAVDLQRKATRAAAELRRHLR
jgi:hypothetical protein